MLEHVFHDQLSLGWAQAAMAALLALAVVGVARLQAIHIEQDTIIALIRAIIQIVAVGSVLIVLLQGPRWTALPVLLAMMVAAAITARQRVHDIPHAFTVSLYGIGVGSGVVIALMTWVGVIDSAITSVVPIGSMLIYRAMVTNGLALDRFKAEVAANAGLIEAKLALGAQPDHVVAPYVQSAVQTGLIPGIDSLRSLGIVWIPGLMAGMIVSGTDPIYAAVYQFVIMAMSFTVAGLTSVVSTLFVRGHTFSPAEQLRIRPGHSDATTE